MLSRDLPPNRNDRHGADPGDLTKQKYDTVSEGLRIGGLFRRRLSRATVLFWERCKRHDMPTNPIVQKIEQMVGAYFEACKMQDAKAISACFVPDAIHYLPHLPPLHGGATIGNALVNDLRNRGGRYFIDKILTNVEQCAAGVPSGRGPFRKTIAFCADMSFAEFVPNIDAHSRNPRVLRRPASSKHCAS